MQRGKMGVVLRWLFPLISLLIWLSLLPLANCYHEEQTPFLAHKLNKRGGDGGGAWWDCQGCSGDRGSFVGLEAEFRKIAEEAAQNLSGRLLIHIGTDYGDELVYWKDVDNASFARECVDAPLYQNFKVLSHLPVEVALSSCDGTLSSKVGRLRNATEQLNNMSLWGDKVEVAKELLSKVNQTLDGNGNRMCDFKKEFQSSLKCIAKAAVTDYLENLHRTIMNLTVFDDDFLTIVVCHKFAYPGSFIVEYYNLSTQETKTKPRIILQPLLSVDDNCSSSNSCSTLKMAAFSMVRTLSLDRKVGSMFLGKEDTAARAHDHFLDSGVKQIICTNGNFSDHEFDCPDDVSPLKGFRTPQEKAYVVLFVCFGALSVVLGIFLLAICYEDRVIKEERSPMSRKKSMERDRTLTGLSEQSVDE